MLGIYFGHESTKIVRATGSDKSSVQVKKLVAANPVIDVLKNKDAEGLAAFFQDVKKMLKINQEDIYIGIPDEFVRIDCDEHDDMNKDSWDGFVEEWVSQFLQVDTETRYVVAPIKLNAGKGRIAVTGVAVPKDIVDVIMEAAELVNFNVASVGPASFGFLRFLNMWDDEHCVMEVNENRTSIVSFSPIKGMFKLEFNNGWNDILNKAEGVDVLFSNIAMHDFTASETYGLANTDIPIYIISKRHDEIASILHTTKFARRIAGIESIPIPLVELKKVDEETACDFCIPIGLILQKKLDLDGMEIEPVNFIPLHVRKETQYQRLKKRIGKIITIWMGVLTAVFLIESGFCYYIANSGFLEVPAQVKSDYEFSLKNKENLAKKMEVLTNAKRENLGVVSIVDAVVKSKPNNIKLMKLEISDTKPGEPGVQIEGYTTDANLFSEFTERLSKQKAFDGAAVNRIGSNESVKTGLIKGSRHI